MGFDARRSASTAVFDFIDENGACRADEVISALAGRFMADEVWAGLDSNAASKRIVRLAPKRVRRQPRQPSVFYPLWDAPVELGSYVGMSAAETVEAARSALTQLELAWHRVVRAQPVQLRLL